LATWLNVSAPTVTEAVHRMVRDGWVEVGEGRAIRLTDQGEITAASIVRRHRILERWLTDVLGFDWVDADIEADRMSATMSDAVVDKIDESVGHPLTCPHGNAIPGRLPPYRDLLALSDIGLNEVVSVRRISEVAEHEARSLLSDLAKMGISEGTQVVVLLSGANANSVSIRVGSEVMELPRSTAEFIWVERSVEDTVA
jgi:DtxR family Mn-dependent transcriptional regulator